MRRARPACGCPFREPVQLMHCNSALSPSPDAIGRHENSIKKCWGSVCRSGRAITFKGVHLWRGPVNPAGNAIFQQHIAAVGVVADDDGVGHAVYLLEPPHEVARLLQLPAGATGFEVSTGLSECVTRAHRCTEGAIAPAFADGRTWVQHGGKQPCLLVYTLCTAVSSSCCHVGNTHGDKRLWANTYRWSGSMMKVV